MGFLRVAGAACVGAVMALSGAVDRAHAESGTTGIYVGMAAIGSIAFIEDIRATGFTGARTVRNDDDLTAALGLIGGYRFDRLPLRLEGELHYRFRFDYDVRDQRAGGAYIGYETNLATTAALANLKWELRHWDGFTPYLQGSFGWARNSAYTDRRDLAGTITERTTHTDNFAMGAGFGFLWDMTESLGLDIGYRYINLGEARVQGFPSGETITADKLTAHDIQLGLIYKF